MLNNGMNNEFIDEISLLFTFAIIQVEEERESLRFCA